MINDPIIPGICYALDVSEYRARRIDRGRVTAIKSNAVSSRVLLASPKCD